MLGELVCGKPQNSCIANSTLDHLKASIDRFSKRSISFLNDAFSEEAQNFGAFCARVVLENSCAALVGRLDPFRLIYLAEFQAQQGFEYGRPSNSGFRWTGDVLPDDKAPQDLWSADHHASKVSRALFSQYSAHVYWKPAVERALDFIASDSSAELSELKNIDPERFLNTTKGRCATLYSTLSKGVHWDFFTSSVIIDEGTIKDSIRESILVLSAISFISHFIPTSYRALDCNSAVVSYKTLRSSFQ